MAAKSKREKIRLEATDGTGHFYTTQKNKQNTTAKLELMRYNPISRKHVLYKEKGKL